MYLFTIVKKSLKFTVLFNEIPFIEKENSRKHQQKNL